MAPSGAIGLFLLGGCATPQHSNVLIFGTNTRLALDVTYDPKTQEPDILFGYKRQEAVWMPLLANVADDSNGSTRMPKPAEVVANKDLLYVGKDGKQTDTYSVLASFGAKFEAKAKNEISQSGGTGGTGKPEASSSGGLAQFFATGLAARILAGKGGEALVSVQKTEAPANARAAEANAEAEKEKTRQGFTKFLDKQRETGATGQAEAEKILATKSDDALPDMIKAAQETKLIDEADATKADTTAKKRQTLLKAFNVGPDFEPNQALNAFLAKVRQP